MPSLPPPGPDRRLALLSLAVCLLAAAAAAVSFVRGSFVGIVWVLMAGVSSNMAWFYLRKAKLARARQAEASG